MKDFKYTMSFAGKISKIENDNEKQKFLSLASKDDNISKLIPKDLDLTNNAGFVLFAGESFIANLLNANQDGVGTKMAIELSKGVPFTYLDINHSRKNICGVAIASAFTDYKTGKILLEEEVKDKIDPFCVTITGIVWAAANPDLAEAIENINNSDSILKDSIYLSWELSLSDQKLILLDKDKNKFSEGKMVSDEKEIEKLLPKLLSNGGNGLTEDGKKIGRIPSGEVTVLGFGLVENPAASVSSIVVNDKSQSTASTTLSDNLIEKLKSLPESGAGYQICDIEMNDGSIIANISVHNCSILSKELNVNDIKDIKLSSEYVIKDLTKGGFVGDISKNQQNNENKISQAENLNVKINSNKNNLNMTIKSLDQITDENIKDLKKSDLTEIFAASTKDLLDSEIKKINDSYLGKLSEKDKAIEAANKASEGLTKSIEELNQKMSKASEDLQKVLSENAQREQVEAFSARMESIENDFDLDDKQKEIVANKVKTLATDADFTNYLAEIEVLLAAKKKAKKTPASMKEDAKDGGKDDDTEDKNGKKTANASLDTKVIDETLKNGEKDKVIIPNTSVGTETIAQRAAKAFGVDGWTVTNKRKNRV